MILPITLQGIVVVRGGGVGVGVVVSIVDKLCKLSAWTSGNQARLTSGGLDLLQNSNCFFQLDLSQSGSYTYFSK